MKRERIKVFFDGGCRPNPGRMEAAVVLRGEEHIFEDLGMGGSEDAEWLALLKACELAQSHGAAFDLIGDSVEVIGQANAILRGDRPTNAHAEAFAALLPEGAPLHIRWVRRGKNLAGIALNRRHPR